MPHTRQILSTAAAAVRKGGSAAFVTSVQVAPGITAPTPAQEKIHFIKQLWRDRLKGVQRNVEVRKLILQQYSRLCNLNAIEMHCNL